jgi:hypothetical protein
MLRGKIDETNARAIIMMEKFDFLLGTWHLDYRVPNSRLSRAMTGGGTGTVKRALKDKYVYFDYEATLSADGGPVGAHAVFAWDDKTKIYRYWWFEDSGSFMTASGYFLDDQTLYINWHDTPFVQTFKKAGPDSVILKMAEPDAQGTYKTVLEVRMTRMR